MKPKKGDVVAIRGDKRLNYDRVCAYTPDQLIGGKYLKHASTGGIWLGIVERATEDMIALKSGGAWGKHLVEVIFPAACAHTDED